MKMSKDMFSLQVPTHDERVQDQMSIENGREESVTPWNQTCTGKPWHGLMKILH